jgi:hypothetical protein
MKRACSSAHRLPLRQENSALGIAVSGGMRWRIAVDAVAEIEKTTLVAKLAAAVTQGGRLSYGLFPGSSSSVTTSANAR